MLYSKQHWTSSKSTQICNLMQWSSSPQFKLTELLWLLVKCLIIATRVIFRLALGTLPKREVLQSSWFFKWLQNWVLSLPALQTKFTRVYIFSSTFLHTEFPNAVPSYTWDCSWKSLALWFRWNYSLTDPFAYVKSPRLGIKPVFTGEQFPSRNCWSGKKPLSVLLPSRHNVIYRRPSIFCSFDYSRITCKASAKYISKIFLPHKGFSVSDFMKLNPVH